MSDNLLSNINNPNDLRLLDEALLPQVARELRNFIIDIVAVKEGHLGASLGVVELTIALHYVFDTPNDLLIWDVGHQAYGHKILTGRRENFHTNRQSGGISGFPKRSESVYDAFGVGHSSTSISAALGMAIASNLKGDFNKQHIAVIGDASIASGMAFEGLNHAGVTDANLLVILNDNAIGIDPSVGALKQYLTAVKEGKNPRQNNIIKSLNFDYSGPIDGHDVFAVIKELKRLQKIKGPKFLHVITTKGKGLQQAEENQVKYHAPGKFDAATGEIHIKSEENLPPKYQDVFGLTVLDLAKKNENIIGITPAMPSGSSLKFMMDAFPKRAFDVGIAEQHAVTLAAGMATQGMIVFCNIYSTFLQRGYDQVIHDVALQNLPVIFCLDRAGLVGDDGYTHHGIFDYSYLRMMPGMTIMAPKDENELRHMLYTALELKRPVSIRYPRGSGLGAACEEELKLLPYGKAEELKKGKDVCIWAAGSMVAPAVAVASQLHNFGFDAGVVNMRFIKPLDEELLIQCANSYNNLVVMEENALAGGVGSEILEILNKNDVLRDTRVLTFGVPDTLVPHGDKKLLLRDIELDVAGMTKHITEWLAEENGGSVWQRNV